MFAFPSAYFEDITPGLLTEILSGVKIFRYFAVSGMASLACWSRYGA